MRCGRDLGGLGFPDSAALHPGCGCGGVVRVCRIWAGLGSRIPLCCIRATGAVEWFGVRACPHSGHSFLGDKTHFVAEGPADLVEGFQCGVALVPFDLRENTR